MKITIDEALKILEINDSPVTKAMIKLTHKRLVSKWHPDRNATGHEMTQKINIARDFLVKQPEPIHKKKSKPSEHNTSKKTEYEPSVHYVCGMIVTKMALKTTVSGNTFRFKELLKVHGFRWHPEEKYWWYDGFYSIEVFLEKSNCY
jgi:hypothetical protein